MNQLSGYIELEMGGEVLPFKFGTNCWALFCEMRRLEFGDIGKSGVFSNDIIARRDLFYCAYKAAVRSKGETPKLNLENFGDLLDETTGIVDKLLETMIASKIMGFTITELAERSRESKKK